MVSTWIFPAMSLQHCLLYLCWVMFQVMSICEISNFCCGAASDSGKFSGPLELPHSLGHGGHDLSQISLKGNIRYDSDNVCCYFP